MLSRPRFFSLVLLFVIVAGLLAACGGSAPAPASQPTAAPAAEPTTAPAAAAPTAAPAAAEPTAAPAAEPTAAPAAEPASGQTLNGITLPADAAPPEQQVLIQHYDNTANFTTIDFYESVYNRG